MMKPQFYVSAHPKVRAFFLLFEGFFNWLPSYICIPLFALGIHVLFACLTSRDHTDFFFFFFYRFCTSLSYYGVTFSVPALSGDRFHNFCYGAGFEFIFFSISFFVLSKVGRKVPLFSFYVLSSFLFLFVFFFALHLSGEFLLIYYL